MADDTDRDSPEHRFGQAVRRAREDRGWSQEALAAQLGGIGMNVGGQSGVARIERGARPTRLNEFVQISEFLLIDLDEVYSADDHLDTAEAISAAEAELVEVFRTQQEASVELGHHQSQVEFYQRTLTMLDRKYARTFRALERAGVDPDAVLKKATLSDGKVGDGDR